MTTNGNVKTNDELKEAARRVVAIGATEVVSRALYDDLAKQVAEGHRMAERYGVRCQSLAGVIDELGRFAVANGWNCEADLQEYREWLATVDDASYRTQ